MYQFVGSYIVTAYGPTLDEVLVYSEGSHIWANEESLKWSEITGERTHWDRGGAKIININVPNISIRFILIGRAPVDGALTVVKQ